MYPRECRGWERSPPREWHGGATRGASSSAGVASKPGPVRRPGRGRPPRTPATGAAGSSPGTAKSEPRCPGWGLVGKSAGAATQLTVAGDVIVPGRVAGGPRGAAELQEKCQVVEGAQRHGERGPHGARSGRRGRRRLTSGLRRPQTSRPPAPARCGLAARLRLLPLRPQNPVGPRFRPPPGSGPAPAAGSERTPSRPPPTAGLFPSAEGHSARRHCRRTPSLPRSPRPPRGGGGGGGGICRLIYHQSFAQAGIFKAVPATSPGPRAQVGARWGGGSHPRDRIPAKHNTTGFRN